MFCIGEMVHVTSVFDFFCLMSCCSMCLHTIPLLWLNISHCISVTHFLDPFIFQTSTFWLLWTTLLSMLFYKELLKSLLSICLSLLEMVDHLVSSQCLKTTAVPLVFSSSVQKGFNVFTSMPILVIFYPFHCNHHGGQGVGMQSLLGKFVFSVLLAMLRSNFIPYCLL